MTAQNRDYACLAFFARTANSPVLRKRSGSRTVGDSILSLGKSSDFGSFGSLSPPRASIDSGRWRHRGCVCIPLGVGPGGVLLAVTISRFASALDGIGRGLIRDSNFARIVEQDLKNRQHRNETGNLNYFTTAFFHHPDELKKELTKGGFPSPRVCAIEGPLWTVPEFETVEEQEKVMATLRALENEVTLIGASGHIMAIATKLA
jgi:hypothetical protein